MKDPDEDFNHRLDGRLRAYAWVLFLIATAVAFNLWSDDMAEWVKSLQV